MFSILGMGAGSAEVSIPTTLKTNLVAWWELNESSGTRVNAHSTGSGYNLTDNNTVGNMSGHIHATAADFTSSNSEYLSVSNSGLQQTANFTIMAWLYNGGDYTDGYFATKAGNNATKTDHEYELFISTTDELKFTTWATTVSSRTATNTTTLKDTASPGWDHIVAIREATVPKLIVNNGSPAISSSSGTQTGTADFRIGKRDDTLGNYLDTGLAVVAFWDKVLSTTEISALYNNGDGLKYTDLP